MKTLQGKHFSITDPKNVNTVIYRINQTQKEYLKDSPKYTLERLDYMEELTGEYKKKTFFVDEPSANSNQLVILSFGKDKVVVNTGIMEENRLRISRKPMPVKFDTI